MKINLNEIDVEQFMVHPHVIEGQTLFLVQPQHIGAAWTQANKHFRSSLWDSDGNLVSAAFPKFMNWGEKPEHFPVPTSIKNTHIVEKVDGSLLILSKWNGNLMLRTRGTVDATHLDNGHELELFKQKYLPKFDGLLGNKRQRDSWDFSFLFEWVSPNQRIILNYGDSPEWYLVGHVNHDDYSLMEQDLLNVWAKDVIGCPRPPSYTFPSVEDLMSGVEQWKGKEGVVIYSDNGQMLHKVKGMWYLALHRMKEALASIDKVIDVWYEQGEPSYQDFAAYITNQFDFELWSQIRGESSRICDASKEVAQIVAGMQRFVTETILPMGDPKDKKTRAQMAPKVLGAYGITSRANFVFKMMDGKTLDSEDRKKLLYQCLKK